VSNIFLSVIIPSYNEKTNLRKGILDKVEHFLSKQKYESEVIVVDDGSTDGSVEFVQEFAKDNSRFQLIKTSHFGKAGAVTSGMLKAKGEYVLFMDMDQATPVEEVTKLLPFIKEYDVVIGSRGSKRQGDPLTRLLMAKGMIVLRSVIVGLRGIQDTQCGFKLFKKDVSDELFSKLEKFHNGYKKISGSSVKAGFDVELLFLAKQLGYEIKEVPVEWFYVESRRVSPIKDSLEAIEDLVQIRVNDISGKYKNL
jgi:glycosyltransferase involved in cell wall biosynthesis